MKQEDNPIVEDEDLIWKIPQNKWENERYQVPSRNQGKI